MDRSIFYRDASDKPRCVRSVADVARALGMEEWTRDATYEVAAEKTAQALKGYCAAKAAVAAFGTLAQEQGRYIPPPQGGDLAMFDGLIGERR